MSAQQLSMTPESFIVKEMGDQAGQTQEDPILHAVTTMLEPAVPAGIRGFVADKEHTQAGQIQEVPDEHPVTTIRRPSVPVEPSGFAMPKDVAELWEASQMEMHTPPEAVEQVPAAKGEEVDVREAGRSNSSRSESERGEENNEIKHQPHHHHYGERDTEKDGEFDTQIGSIPCDQKNNEIVSTGAILSSDSKILATFLKYHGKYKPSFAVDLHGTHQKLVTRPNANGEGSNTETITDFNFSIDLSPLLTEEPVIYSVPDHILAFRGGRRMAIEIGGAQPIDRRNFVESSQQDDQENAVGAARRAGRPPWLASAKSSPDLEAGNGSTPQASSRTFEEWLEDYCRSRQVGKEFIFNKEIFAWDFDSLTKSIRDLIASTGYVGLVHVNFSHKPNKVHVSSPSMISKIFSSYLLIFLTSIILVFPFLWVWRRLSGAEGKWETCGMGFRIKTWELISGTSRGETIRSAQARLGDALKGRKLRAKKEGVFMMRGVHEADWFRQWGLSIMIGVKEGKKTKWLEDRKSKSPVPAVEAIAVNLDHL